MNERESEMVRGKKVGILAVIAHQRGTEVIDPGKTPFRCEALFVNSRVEQAFPSTLVLSKVGNDLMVETDFAGIPIEGTVGVKIRTSEGQAQASQVLESRLQLRFEVEGVMMVARHYPGRSDDGAMGIGNR